MRHAVVTGCGVVSPVGLDQASFWSALVEGRSGIGPITGFDASDLPTQIAGEVRDFDPTRVMPSTLARRIDPFAQYAVAAALEAIEQAKLVVEQDSAARVAVLIGTGYGASKVGQAATRALDGRGPRALSPYLAVSGSSDNAAAEVALLLGAHGPTGAVSTACATGTTAIGEAMRMIRHGYADVVIAGGADDSVTRQDIAAAALVRALSRRNDEPAKACRPFDRQRDGFVMSAGAGIVVLEEAEHAARRGAPISAEVCGYGATTDAHHPTAPQPEGRGATAAMREALADAGVGPEQVDYVNAHGTSTRLNDAIESAAIRAVLGPRATRVPISSTKSMTGHMIGAAGAVELIATVLAMTTETVPPTLNCDDPEDPELDYVPHVAREHRARVAMSNSFGFGGHNAVLVVKAVDE